MNWSRRWHLDGYWAGAICSSNMMKILVRNERVGIEGRPVKVFS